MPRRIYLSPPHLGSHERRYVEQAFRSNWIAPLGPQVDAFEREFSERVGVRHAVALASGTAALHLTLRHIGLKGGDEVLCSTLTFAASAFPVLYEGGRPVFIDADPATWNIDTELVRLELERASRRGRLPRAVISVDLYGHCADYAKLRALCRRHRVPLIEDAAEALGATYRGRAAGSFGWANVFSFNGNKIITTSGGGMLATDDARLAAAARKLSQQARDPAPHYEHSEVGFNYRLSNVLAAIGRGQLRELPRRVAARRRIFASYRRRLSALPGLTFMPEAAYGRSNRWLTCVLIDPERFGATREDVRLRLAEANIEARPLWKPLHLQPIFARCRRVGGAVSEGLFQLGLCLPSGSSMSERDVARVSALVAGTALPRPG